MSGDKMIDWGRIEELRSDFGEDDFLEIVSMFLGEVKTKLDDMSAASNPPVSADFHFLKGSAANLGFCKFQAACAVAEQSNSAVDLAEIKTLFIRSREVFLAEIEARKAVA